MTIYLYSNKNLYPSSKFIVFYQNRKNTFSSKAQNMHFPAKNVKHIFSAKIVKTHFLAKTAKTHLRPKNKSAFF